MVKFLIKIEETSKVVRVDESYKDLYAKIREAFPELKKEFVVKYVDKDFPSQYNEINSLDDLDDRESNILEVSFTLGPLSDILESSSLEITSESTSEIHPPSPPVVNKAFPSDTQVDNDDDDEGNSFNNIQKESIEATLPNWPFPFIITDNMIRTSVIRKLENKEMLTSKDRSILFSGLYDVCTRYLGRDPYPGRKYGDMINALLRRWPYLHQGVSFQEGFITYRCGLRDHFKNKKRYLKNGVNPKVDAMKRKFTTKKKAIDSLIDRTEDPASRNIFGVPNFAPDRYPGVDQVAVDYFIDSMKKQSELRAELRDQASLILAMDKTFPERRSMLLREMCPLRVLLDTYPLLHGRCELLNEFSRITGTDPLLPLSNVLNSANNILAIGMEKKINKIFSISSLIVGAEDMIEKTNMLGIAALLCVPLILKEKLDIFLLKSDTGFTHPRIICETYDPENVTTVFTSNFFMVMVEDNVILESSDFCEAFIIMFASYYIFNLMYPPELEGTMTFFQRSVFKIGDNVKLKQKVLHLIASLATMQ